MGRMKGPDEGADVVRLLVEVAPEDPAQLAMELAEALQSEALYGADARTYDAQAAAERASVQSLMQVEIDVRERRRRERDGEVFKRRRMDPMAEYDLDAIKAEVQGSKDRVQKYAKIANEQRAKAAESKAKIPGLQRRIHVARETIRERANRRTG